MEPITLYDLIKETLKTTKNKVKTAKARIADIRDRLSYVRTKAQKMERDITRKYYMGLSTDIREIINMLPALYEELLTIEMTLDEANETIQETMRTITRRRITEILRETEIETES